MTDRRSRLVFWTGGMVAGVLGMVAAGPLVGGDPTLVAAQTIIEVSPGPVATWAIETYGSAAQVLLIISVSAFLIAVGTGAGLLMQRFDPGRR